MKHSYFLLVLLLTACTSPKNKINYDDKKRISTVSISNYHDNLVYEYDTLGFLSHVYYYEPPEYSNHLKGIDHYIMDSSRKNIRFLTKHFYGNTQEAQEPMQTQIMDTSEFEADVIYKMDSLNRILVVIARKKENNVFKVVKIDSNYNKVIEHLYAKDWEQKIHKYEISLREKIMHSIWGCK